MCSPEQHLRGHQNPFQPPLRYPIRYSLAPLQPSSTPTDWQRSAPCHEGSSSGEPSFALQVAWWYRPIFRTAAAPAASRMRRCSIGSCPPALEDNWRYRLVVIRSCVTPRPRPRFRKWVYGCTFCPTRHVSSFGGGMVEFV